MDFMLTIVSEKNSPTLSVKMDSDAATLFAIRLMDIFADEVKFENGLVVKGRTYQQKTPELIIKLREFIQNNGNQQVLWQYAKLTVDTGRNVENARGIGEMMVNGSCFMVQG